IQNIEVQNLPNIYTRVDADDNIINDYPDVQEGGADDNIINDYPDVQEGGAADNDSIIDLSRAVDLETMLVTQGDFEDLAGQAAVGDLTLTGISNGAIVTLDGHFDTSGDVRLNYTGSSPADGISVVFNNLNMMSDLEVAHNATRLNIESTGAGNYVFAGDLGGNDAALRDLVITGDAQLFIEGDLDESFQDNNPVTIDASANTGGVNLNLTGSDNVTFLGSQGDDRFDVSASESVTIEGGEGDNVLDVSTETAVISVGDGDNVITAMDNDSVSITTGDGDNEIATSAAEISIATGAGNDAIIVAGTDGDYTEGLKDDEDGAGALITLDTGGGSDVLQLGYQGSDGIGGSGRLIAKEGSSITGEDITLFVQTISDLRAASLEGISRIILDDDDTGSGASQQANDAAGGVGNKSVLTITDEQASQFAADGVDISVEGGIFHTSGHIKIIVTEDLDLTSTTWSDWLDTLPANVDLRFEINDGATLKLTAEQLHTKVTQQGITIADDGNTDQLSGSVLIEGAGIDFDPFNNSDQIRTEIDGREYVGGSLSADDFANDDDTGSDPGAGTIERDEWGFNVLVDRSINGYNRPADAPSYSRLVIDTDSMDGDLGPVSTIETFLRIVGESDLTFTPVEGGIDDWGRPIEGGSAIQLGVDNGAPTNAFMVDFSDVQGEVNNLTLAHFENVDAMFGNGTTEVADVRVNVEIGGDYDSDNSGEAGLNDGIVASADSGLVSRGIQTYVVTDITTDTGTAEFWTSRPTEDLETLGLQGNYEDTIIFGNTERGVDFLMEVVYDKFDGYAVGSL
ncbi:MAG: hypothetical protein LC687_01800, partial [Actinobacteria bacterium]|nr:hypothetical protein [Actinomycetota bacterium]